MAIDYFLESSVRHITTRENDSSSYIREQSNMMISNFLEYLNEHAVEIGLQLQKTYSFIPVTSYEDDRYGGCHVPTGNFGIYDKSTKSFIVTSSDFYFSKELYDIKRGFLDELICRYSNWYKEYEYSFVLVFFDTLAKRYNYGETFKLTFNSNNRDFTLELV